MLSIKIKKKTTIIVTEVCCDNIYTVTGMCELSDTTQQYINGETIENFS